MISSRWLGRTSSRLLTGLAVAVTMTTAIFAMESVSTGALQPGSARVSKVGQQELIERLASGDRVVFVDSRESAEYAEERIPGAVNLPLRHVNAETIAPLLDEPVVVAYCLKDFRGFELAKALARAGVENVHVMSTSGINGWKALGLPTAGERPGIGDEAALEKLAQCARSQTCIKAKEAKA